MGQGWKVGENEVGQLVEILEDGSRVLHPNEAFEKRVKDLEDQVDQLKKKAGI